MTKQDDPIETLAAFVAAGRDATPEKVGVERYQMPHLPEQMRGLVFDLSAAPDALVGLLKRCSLLIPLLKPTPNLSSYPRAHGWSDTDAAMALSADKLLADIDRVLSAAEGREA